MTCLTKITISPSTILEIEADELTPETRGILACVRSLDFSMPEMEDDIDLERSYKWVQHVDLSRVYELHIHSYCQWWCARAGLILNGLVGCDIDKLVLDVYCDSGLKLLARSLCTIPNPMLLAINLNIIHFPCTWSGTVKEDLKKVDKALMEIVDRDAFIQMTKGICSHNRSWFSRGFHRILYPHIWRQISIRCSTNLTVPRLLSMMHDARSLIDFMAVRQHVIPLVRQLHIVGPFTATPAAPHHSHGQAYSNRDTITTLMALLHNLHGVSFFNVVLDELPIHTGKCGHIKQVRLLFCSASTMGMNTFMSNFLRLNSLEISWPEPTLSTLYFYRTKFLQVQRDGSAFIDSIVRCCQEAMEQKAFPAIDTLAVRPGWDADPLACEHIDIGCLPAFLKITGRTLREFSAMNGGLPPTKELIFFLERRGSKAVQPLILHGSFQPDSDNTR
ncbi:hypothetical protein EV421DRAFT_1737801 [Armillaria borealis]|uniref:Uncharacterized protein n=1 Tax=Armillaria borealis TaxID=47425 RepID=A0AA39MN79_9AGAR|nr:hypothetical protein EV421DRAFT_1737801 [Armillaria borealis]